eukprot:jgi/Psemu1/322910/estExt_fgenesh1_pg.C_470039
MPAMRCCHSSTTRGLTCFCLLLRLLLLVLSSSTTTEFVSGWMLSPHTATTRNANANANARARATAASLPNRRRAEHPSFSFSPSSSFSFSRTTSCLLRQAQQQQDNDFRDNDNDDGDEGDGEMEFFDDFGFVVGGDNNYNSYSYSYSYSYSSEEEEPSGEGSPPRNRNPEEAESESELSSLSILQERLERVATTEQGNQQQISDNWKDGYWGVWGCSLDPYGGEGDETETETETETSQKTVVTCFPGFTSRNPGVSTLLAAGPGTLGNTNGNTNGNGNGNGNAGGNRPPTKSLIAGDMTGGLKQWDLLPAGKGRLEYWPRMASQKLPGGRPHVYETRGDYYSHSEDDEGGTPWSPAIRGLLCIQQRVLLAATDHDLTVWDSETGKALYDMQGLNFGLGVGVGVGGASASASDAAPLHRPSLVAANDSVLITNGMEQLVCVHDFAMDRVTSETVEDFLERDTTDGLEDDERGSNPGERW